MLIFVRLIIQSFILIYRRKNHLVIKVIYLLILRRKCIIIVIRMERIVFFSICLASKIELISVVQTRENLTWRMLPAERAAA